LELNASEKASRLGVQEAVTVLPALPWRIFGSVNSCSEPMIVNSPDTTSAGRMCGTLMLMAVRISPAPSSRAASSTDGDTLCSATYSSTEL